MAELTSQSGPRALVRTPDGRTVWMRPGDLIGRIATARLRLDDPRVSEVQAYLSLRGRALVLVALKGMLRGRSGRRSELPLEPGRRIHLLRELAIEVVDVVLPDTVPALSVEGGETVDLNGTVVSIRDGTLPELVSGFEADASAHVWADVDGCQLSLPGQPARLISVGVLQIPGLSGEVRLVERAIVDAGVAPTRLSGRIDAPLRIELRQETVFFHQTGRPTAELAGMPARLLCEVARFDAPTPWDWVAREVWGRELDRDTLRQRWDRTLRNLRKKLRGIGVREDLVRPDWSGNVELVLGPEDTVDDRG